MALLASVAEAAGIVGGKRERSRKTNKHNNKAVGYEGTNGFVFVCPKRGALVSARASCKTPR